jgi:hypothetical protein
MKSFNFAKNFLIKIPKQFNSVIAEIIEYKGEKETLFPEFRTATIQLNRFLTNISQRK